MTTSCASNRLSTSSDLTKGGNGKYRPLKTKGGSSKAAAGVYDPFNPSYNRMSFKSTKDPVFIAFEHIEKQNPIKLTTDLIKDGITSSINTIGKKLVKLFN